MSKQIWKFNVLADSTRIVMPKDAEILTVEVKQGDPYIWALVNPENEKETRVFQVFATGQDIPKITARRDYIGTFQIYGGSLVFHLFEVFEDKTK